MGYEELEKSTLLLIEKISKEELSKDDYSTIIDNEVLTYSLLNYFIKNNKGYKETSIKGIKLFIDIMFEKNIYFLDLIIPICVFYKFEDTLIKIDFLENIEDYKKSLFYLNEKEDIIYLLKFKKNKYLNTELFNFFIDKNKEINNEIVKNNLSLIKDDILTDKLENNWNDYYTILFKEKKNKYSFKNLLNNKNIFLSNIHLVDKLNVIKKKEIYKKYINEIIENKKLYNKLNKDIIFDIFSLMNNNKNEKEIIECIKNEKNIRNEHVILTHENYKCELIDYLNIQKIKDVEKAIKITFNGREEKNIECLNSILSYHTINEEDLINIIKNLQKSSFTKHRKQLILLVKNVKDKNKIFNVLLENEYVALEFVEDIKVNKEIANRILRRIFQNDNINEDKVIKLLEICSKQKINLNWPLIFEDAYHFNKKIMFYMIDNFDNLLDKKYLIELYNQNEILLKIFNKKDPQLTKKYIEDSNEYLSKRKQKIFELYEQFKSINNF